MLSAAAAAAAAAATAALSDRRTSRSLNVLHFIALGGPPVPDHLVGLVVKATATRAEDPGFESRLRVGSSHTSDLKLGTPLATLPGVWRYRVSAGTGWPGVSIL